MEFFSNFKYHLKLLLKSIQEFSSMDTRRLHILKDFVYVTYLEKNLTEPKYLRAHQAATGDCISSMYEVLQEVQFTESQNNIIIYCSLKLLSDPVYIHLNSKQKSELDWIGSFLTGKEGDWVKFSFELSELEATHLIMYFEVQSEYMKKLRRS
ncbi:hypothetical protein E4414_02210 [Leptospira interrogans]|uniref:hypothetical protein n=1 Tax=Leptospira interrogans TaxID=173 RepID=UPI0010C10F71|nr:hypothetical protein [Leptospira interrogans]QCO32043.1 hypothetical protein E4414_02210 [Leptospira interrogans]